MTPKELEDIYTANFEKIYRFFFYKTRSKDDAEDLTSQTFLAFADSPNKDDIKSTIAYLYGISKNIFYRYIREKCHTVPLSEDQMEWIAQVEQTISQGLAEDTFEKKLLPLIERLPPMQRQIMQLIYIENLGVAGTVSKLGKTENYVKTTKKRAIKNIKKLILDGGALEDDIDTV